MFSGCTVLPDSNETEFRNRDQGASPSAGINTGIVLVPTMLHMEVHMEVPTVILGRVDISNVPWCHLFRQMSSL